MSKKTLLKIFLILFLIILPIGFYFIFTSLQKTEKSNPTKIEFYSDSYNETKKESENIDFSKIRPSLPAFNLPLSISQITNLEVLKKIPLSKKDMDFLLRNGFVVIDTPKDIREYEVTTEFTGDIPLRGEDDFYAYYLALYEKELPCIITPDVMLHYYHLFFDIVLSKLEEKLFYEYIWEIVYKLLDKQLEHYNSTTSKDLKEAVKLNICYLSTILELLKPKKSQVVSKKALEEIYPKDLFGEDDIKEILENYTSGFTEFDLEKYKFTTPSLVRDIVNKELNLIEKHASWDQSPIFVYKEDYSQYIPRGHYTNSERLKNYFKALMYLGRMVFLINGSPEISEGETSSNNPHGIISIYDAKKQTIGACILTYDLISDKELFEKWEKIYKITSFFVGYCDDVGPYQYYDVLKRVLGSNIVLDDIEKNYEKIKNLLKVLPYDPKIYSGLGELKLEVFSIHDEENIEKLTKQAKELLQLTKGFKLLGQRFTLDSWVFSELVSPFTGEYIGEKLPLPKDGLPFTYVWNDRYTSNRPFTWVKTFMGREVRGFPRGLDVMAILGSERAYNILENEGDTKYSLFKRQFNKFKLYIDNLKEEDWNRNIYMGWLFTIKTLLRKFGEGYPTFMRTDAYQDRCLNTSLASWVELKHDTQLYVKQSYSIAELGEGEDEEIPLEVMAGYVEPNIDFYKQLLNLLSITKKGLKENFPDKLDYISDIIYKIEGFSNLVEYLGKIVAKELENKFLDKYDYQFIKNFYNSLYSFIRDFSNLSNPSFGKDILKPDILKTTLITDVHTDGNTKLVLEEGTGNIKTMIVAYMLPNNTIILGVGPVLSYYEFKQPIGQRLTDEEWRNMLKGKHPPIPNWTRSFYTGE